MDLVGGWVRQLLGAGIVAALVPVAIVAALAVVLTEAGGFGGLGSLGQLLTGPQISPAQALVAAVPRARPTNGRDVALVAPPTLVADATPAVAGAQPGAAGGNGAPERPAATQPGRVEPPTPAVVLAPPPPPVAPPPVASPFPPPAAPPTARERTGKVVEELGETVDDVVGGVGEVIGGLGETLGGILGGPPPRR